MSAQSPPPSTPAHDVLSLFAKANISNLRYQTFAAREVPKIAGEATLVVTPEASQGTAAAANGNPRWTLHSVFEANAKLRLASRRPGLPPGSGPGLSFVSYAGGVGKTTLCAALARVSSRTGHVLLADRCAAGIMPYYFNLQRQSAGALQVVYPDGRRPGYPITLVVAPWSANTDAAAWLERLQAESSLTLQDIPTLTGPPAEDALEHGANRFGQLAVPLLPDVQSIASIALIEELSRTLESKPNNVQRILFVLNRFDDARPLHREIRAHLENTLQDRLAPVAIRESEHVAEALSQGMTVVDHAPQAAVVKDLENLAHWLDEQLSSAVEAGVEKTEIA